MRRRSFVITAALGTVALPFRATAQQAGGRRRVVGIGLGYELTSPESSPLTRKLAELGWINGQNIVIERRSTRNPEDLLRIASEVVNSNPDVIVAAGTPAALAVRQATSTIPIVMAMVGDPIGRGLVVSLARPGGNVTGPSLMGPDMGAKWLDVIKEVAPQISRVVRFRDATNQQHMTADRSEMHRVARQLRLTVQYIDIRSAADVPVAIAAAVRERAEAMLINPLAIISLDQLRMIADAAKQHRMPTITGRRDYVEAGVLLYYGANFLNDLSRAAVYVDKILRGAKPADLPVEQPTTFELIVNLKTARAIGLTIPQSLLIRADEVIE